MVAVWNSEPAQKTERPLHEPLEFYSNVLASWLRRCGETLHGQFYIIVYSAMLLITAFTRSHCMSAISTASCCKG